MSDNPRPEGDLIECECGVTFAALRCPALDCQKEQPGICLVTEAQRKVLDACAALDSDWLDKCKFSRDIRLFQFAEAELARRAK